MNPVAAVALAALGGGLGAVLRHAASQALGRRSRGEIPWPTALVNLSGSLLLGVLTGLAPPTGALLLLGTGVLGGYTTFSTASLETVRLTLTGRVGARTAVLYALGTALGCLLAAAAGHLAGVSIGSATG